MKKSLLLFFVACISLSTIAAPWDIASLKSNNAAWDKPLFDDPYLTDLTIDLVTSPTFPYTKTLKFHVVSDHWVNYNQKVTIAVWGDPWQSTGTYGMKNFDVTIWAGETTGNLNYTLVGSDNPSPSFYDIIYMGPK